MIWRYMDLAKFVAMLHPPTSLAFPRADKFEDPFEGKWSTGNLAPLRKLLESMGETAFGAPPDKVFGAVQAVLAQHRTTVAINCWHLSDHESVAMWALYAARNQGIAVRSTFGRLIDAVRGAGRPVYIAEVQYHDYQAALPSGTYFHPFIHKRKWFEYERELRALVTSVDLKSDGNPTRFVTEPGAYSPLESVVKVPVDLNRLVEAVLVPPTCPDWMYDVVCSVMDKYGLPGVPKRSSLDEPPPY